MKTQELVCLQAAETGANRPFEFVIGAVDNHGALHQLAGVDEDIAHELVSMAISGASIAAQELVRARADEGRLAFERGDTPEMARQPEWRERRRPSGRLPIPPGTEVPPPVLSGRKPESQT
jgi:hypothetical protein